MTEDKTFDRRLRSAFAATAPDDAPRTDCPPAREIWDAVVEQLDPPRLRALIVHVASCSACTESWRLASEIAHDGASDAGVADLPNDADRRYRWTGWVSAVAATLVFAVVSLTSSWTIPEGSIARSGPGVPRLELIRPERPLTSAECRVQWTEFPGATYDVQVLTERFELLTERSNLTEPAFKVPEDLIGSLPAGSGLRAHVEVKRGLAGVVADGTFDLPCAR